MTANNKRWTSGIKITPGYFENIGQGKLRSNINA